MKTFGQRAANRLMREARAPIERIINCFCSTFPEVGGRATLDASFFAFLDHEFLKILSDRNTGAQELILQQTKQVCANVFNLLGSGPTTVVHGLRCKGFSGITYPASPAIQFDSGGRWLVGRINRANLKESQRIWQRV